MAIDLQHFRLLLLELRTAIQAELGEEGTADSSIVPDNAIGRLTRMEAIQAQSISNAGRGRNEKRLVTIERALKAIEDGTYGSCVKCGNDIPQGRLEIRPESRLCVPCVARA